MKKIIDAIITLIILALVVSMLLAMLRPYAPYMALAIILLLVGGAALRYYRTW